jgi:hypothetical protein
MAQVKDIRSENHQLTVWEVAKEAMSRNFNRRFRDALGLSKIFVRALNWIRELNAVQSVKISYNMWMTFFLNCQHWRWDLDICE